MFGSLLNPVYYIYEGRTIAAIILGITAAVKTWINIDLDFGTKTGFAILAGMLIGFFIYWLVPWILCLFFIPLRNYIALALGTSTAAVMWHKLEPAVFGLRAVVALLVAINISLIMYWLLGVPGKKQREEHKEYLKRKRGEEERRRHEYKCLKCNDLGFIPPERDPEPCWCRGTGVDRDGEICQICDAYASEYRKCTCEAAYKY